MLILLRFLRFFQNPKKRDFLRFFALLHTFSRTMVYCTTLIWFGFWTSFIRTLRHDLILVVRVSPHVVLCTPGRQARLHSTLFRCNGNQPKHRSDETPCWCRDETVWTGKPAVDRGRLVCIL